MRHAFVLFTFIPFHNDFANFVARLTSAQRRTLTLGVRIASYLMNFLVRCAESYSVNMRSNTHKHLSPFSLVAFNIRISICGHTVKGGTLLPVCVCLYQLRYLNPSLYFIVSCRHDILAMLALGTSSRLNLVVLYAEHPRGCRTTPVWLDDFPLRRLSSSRASTTRVADVSTRSLLVHDVRHRPRTFPLSCGLFYLDGV